MVHVAKVIGDRWPPFRSEIDVVHAAGRLTPSGVFESEYAAGVVVAAVLGGAVGALLGVLLRRLFPIWARVLASSVLLAAIWIALQAFLLRRFGPPFGTLPLAPMVAGTVAFGACVGLLRPRRRRPALVEG